MPDSKEIQALQKVNDEVRRIRAFAHLAVGDETISYDVDEDAEQREAFVINGKRFGFYRHMVGGYKDALEGAKRHALTLLSPLILQQMLGWFSSGDISELMTAKGEQADYQRIMNAANAIVRGLDI